MKNRRKVVKIKGKTRVIKSDESREFEEVFALEAKKVRHTCRRDGNDSFPINGDLFLSVAVRYQNDRSDLDCELIPDLLEKYEIIVNDRQFYRKFYEKAVDPKKEPLVSIWIWPYEQ